MEIDRKSKTRLQEATENYEKSKVLRRLAIKAEPSRWKRLWLWVWFYSTWPFRYLWTQLHDWRFVAMFAVVCLVVSCEVWVPLSLSLFIRPIGWSNQMWSDLWTAIVTHTIPSGNGTLKSAMFVTGITLLGVWWMPGTPFLLLCTTMTVGIKALFDKIKSKKGGK